MDEISGAGPAIGYILKGFPRLSETFIAGEIHRVEQRGLPIRLFVLKPPEPWQPAEPHPVVRRIRAVPRYFPGTTPLSGVTLRGWLPANLPPFLPSLARTAKRHPLGTARAAAAGFAQAVRARRTRWSLPRKVYLKEFLQAAVVADEVDAVPGVRHLHAHFAHGATTVAWLAGLITGLPFSFTAHAHDLYNDSLNPAGLLRRKLRAARFAVTCTAANRRHLLTIEPRTPVHLVYHGLNPDFARFLADADGDAARPESLRILAVGRLVAKKGFDTLVEACGLLLQGGIPFEAVIAGQAGDLSGTVRARIEALDLGDRVCLPGAMGQAELFAEYRRAGVFCMPSRVLPDDRDGIPNVLVEAMACGLPVVTTPVSGIPELVTDGVDGLLVAPDDPGALAAAILRLHREPELASRLGTRARATVAERFDGERLAEQLAGLFRTALGLQADEAGPVAEGPRRAGGKEAACPLP
jgi:glycosyltransferase involved in cell wall biosynthesis